MRNVLKLHRNMYNRRKMLLTVLLIIIFVYGILFYNGTFWTEPSKYVVFPTRGFKNLHEGNVFRIKPFIVLPFKNQCDTSLLPNLSNIQWPPLNVAPFPAGQLLPDGSRYIVPPSFDPVISQGQRELFFRLLNAFSNLMFENGLGESFFLMASTLVGSYRHHDFMPWDDDVDILADMNKRPIIRKLFQNSLPDDLMWDTNGRVDKLFTKTISAEQEKEDLPMSRKLTKYRWNWPFLDIGYYKQNVTHIWEYKVAWPKSEVFPLLFRPFYKIWYLTPLKSFQFLYRLAKYDEHCLKPSWNHYLEKDQKLLKIPCKQLNHRYALVKRRIYERNPDIRNISQLQTNGNELVIAEENLYIIDKHTNIPHLFHSLLVVAHIDDVLMDPLNGT